MNKIILFITLFISTETCFAQKNSINPTLDTMRAVQKRLYADYPINPLTGEFIRYFPYSGKKELEVHYVNGIPVGKYQEWYDNGNIKLVGYYNENGNEEGLFQKWYKNGVLHIVGYYKNGVRDSIWTFNRSDKSLEKKGHYNNGLKNGVWEYFTLTGELYLYFEYRNGVEIQIKIIMPDSIIEQEPEDSE